MVYSNNINFKKCDWVCDCIVLTYNKLKYTKEFVDSLLKNTHEFVRVIFVDNNSTDGTREYILSLDDTKFCCFEHIFNNRNEGFIKANNQGIDQSTAPYICLMNNDLLLTEGWLSEMVSVFQSDSQIGLLNPNSNGLGMSPHKEESIADLAKTLKSKYQGQMVEMPFCVGFCMMFSREVLQKVGKLSEELLPMFFEDTDYSRRVIEAGYRIGLAKGSYAWHHEHVSMNQFDQDSEGIFNDSKAVYLKKWGKPLRIAWVLNDVADLENVLKKAIKYARQGNYIWIFLKGVKGSKSDVFKKYEHREFSDVNVLSYKTVFSLAFYIAVKKKKYDLLISPKYLLKLLTKRYFRGILSVWNDDFVKSLKFSSE